MMHRRHLMQPVPLDIADVFSTDIWAGDSSTRTITNGVNLSGLGGMVWIKSRSTSASHRLLDTQRGATYYMDPAATTASTADVDTLTAFNSDGFDLGADANVNSTSQNYAGWSFRKAPQFFDHVTYTGDGVAGREIAHGLGSEPGMIIVKVSSTTSAWSVYHRSNTAEPETEALKLDVTDATADLDTYWNDTAPTSAVFTVGSGVPVNLAATTYEAYLFAHNPASAGSIQCGGYIGNGSTTGPTITLGWEPQWLMIKRSDAAGSWYVWDNQRSPSNPRNNAVKPDASFAEVSGATYDVDFTSTGFQIKTATAELNTNTGEFIYVAIRAE